MQESSLNKKEETIGGGFSPLLMGLKRRLELTLCYIQKQKKNGEAGALSRRKSEC